MSFNLEFIMIYNNALQEKFTFIRKTVVDIENVTVKVCDSPFVSK